MKRYEVTVEEVEDCPDIPVIRETWRLNGLVHREHGPAITERSAKTGNLRMQAWLTDGRLHREDGPAFMFLYYPDDLNGELQVFDQAWYQHGVEHRDQGPAVISVLGENVRAVSYYQRGLLHRSDGPAALSYDRDGKEVRVEFYLNGEHVPPFEIPTSRLDLD